MAFATYQKRYIIEVAAGATITFDHGVPCMPDKVFVSIFEGDEHLTFSDWEGSTVKITNPGVLDNKSDVVFQCVHSSVS